MSIRTDLALEAHQMYREKNKSHTEGVSVDIKENDGVTITEIKITNESGEKAIGKPIGTYITIEAPDMKYSQEVYKNACKAIADSICSLAGNVGEEPVMIAGLGNEEITPDALGPLTVSKLIITRHMKNTEDVSIDSKFANICAIAPGVLGTTGIETLSIIKGASEAVKPKLVIAVDALAAMSTDRICTTIQICDTGIQPGAGIGNRREGLNEKSLGTKVIAVGIPTVVDAATIAFDFMDRATEKSGGISDREKEAILENAARTSISRLVVTPKDIDLVIERGAKTVANGINMAFFKNLTFEEIEGLVD